MAGGGGQQELEEDMENEYKIPDIDFIKEYFDKIRFGMVKPSELELFMFYLLAYHRDDLNKSVWELAKDYYITEQKAARFKLEIRKRFTSISTKDDMLLLAQDIFQKKIIPLECENEKIGILIHDPCYQRSLKESLSMHNLPYDVGNNGSLFRLPQWVFLAVFAKSGYNDIQKYIKGAIKNHLDDKTEYEKLFSKGIPVSYALKKILIDNAGDILGAIPVMGDILSVSLKVGKKVLSKKIP